MARAKIKVVKKKAYKKFAEKRMHAFKHGKMHSGRGGKKGLKQKKSVGKKSQGIAIMLSEARKKGLIR